MTPMTRDEWLTARRGCLGASDVAAVLGADPRRGPLAVYESKVTGYSQDDNDWLKFGREVEGAIANMFEQKAEMHVLDHGATVITYHPDYPWIGATLDRVVVGLGPLEIKNIGDPRVRPKEWRADPPMHNQIQLQTQIACVDNQRGILTGLFPGYNLVWKEIWRDDDLLESAYPILADFWENHVIARVPPPPDDLPGTLDVCKRLWSEEDGKTVALDADTLELVEDWERAKVMREGHKKEAKTIEAKLRAKIQTATFGALPDGTFLSLKTTKNPGGTREIEPYEYRSLRRSKERK